MLARRMDDFICTRFRCVASQITFFSSASSFFVTISSVHRGDDHTFTKLELPTEARMIWGDGARPSNAMQSIGI